MAPSTILRERRSFDSVRLRFAPSYFAQDDCIKVVTFFILLVLCATTAFAQTAGKYEFYRYLQRYAVTVDPLGQIFGRASLHFEDRLDPNFTRLYEVSYQKEVANMHTPGWYHESSYTIGAIERIYLVDNAAMIGQYVGVGTGVGMVNVTIAWRLTAEIGYKLMFG